MFQGLLADGRPVGVHFILSVDARNGLPGSLGSSVQSRVVLRMATVDDYGFLGVPMDVLSMASPPGRALVGDREVQCAVLGGTSDVTVQAKAAAGFAEAVRKSGQAPAAEIRSLVDTVDLSTLPDRAGELPVLGIGSSTLGPTGFDPRGTFVVVGPSGSGRTTTLATIGAALRRWDPEGALVLLTPRKSSDLLRLPIWTDKASTSDAIVELAGNLRTAIAEGSAPEHVTVVIERVDDLAGIPTEQPVADLVKALVDNDHFVVAEGETTWFSSNFGLPGALKTSRSGMSLQPDGIESQSIFKNSFPAYNRAEMPEGRGFLVQRGRNELLQVALPR
jgi:S-DNA-T family DNA segregation ATPase FtsK/SpoIIIE